MFESRLQQAAARIQAQFDTVFAGLADEPVVHAMHYAAKGGKRLRGFLVLEGAVLYDVSPDQAIWPAAAIEALHAYSLVHDDLPCMDDDDTRRGRPTVHVKWNDTTAVLAGDALQSLAFELVTAQQAGPGDVRAALALSLAQASGARGMVLGQALDIAAETAGTPLTLAQIETLQKGKTGALIEWSGCAGALMAGADPGPLRQYARALGLAFQIADDILDVEGDSARAGKRLQKDAEAGKATFVSLMGLEEARQRSVELVQMAQAALDPFGSKADTLRAAAQFVITRDN